MTFSAAVLPPLEAAIDDRPARLVAAARDLANESGNANTRGKSATFNADPAKRYSVNVHVATPTNGLPGGTIIACGDLSASKAGGKSKPKKPHPPQAKGPKS